MTPRPLCPQRNVRQHPSPKNAPTRATRCPLTIHSGPATVTTSSLNPRPSPVPPTACCEDRFPSSATQLPVSQSSALPSQPLPTSSLRLPSSCITRCSLSSLIARGSGRLWLSLSLSRQLGLADSSTRSASQRLRGHSIPPICSSSDHRQGSSEMHRLDSNLQHLAR